MAAMADAMQVVSSTGSMQEASGSTSSSSIKTLRSTLHNVVGGGMLDLSGSGFQRLPLDQISELCGGKQSGTSQITKLVRL